MFSFPAMRLLVAFTSIFFFIHPSVRTVDAHSDAPLLEAFASTDAKAQAKTVSREHFSYCGIRRRTERHIYSSDALSDVRLNDDKEKKRGMINEGKCRGSFIFRGASL